MSDSQEVSVVPKKRGGRPKKPPGEKREATLMLRLNMLEHQELYALMREHGWPGDPSSFVRDLILSKRKSRGGVSAQDLISLEHTMTLLIAYLDDLSGSRNEEQRECVKEIQRVMSDAAQSIYRAIP